GSRTSSDQSLTSPIAEEQALQIIVRSHLQVSPAAEPDLGLQLLPPRLQLLPVRPVKLGAEGGLHLVARLSLHEANVPCTQFLRIDLLRRQQLAGDDLLARGAQGGERIGNAVEEPVADEDGEAGHPADA